MKHAFSLVELSIVLVILGLLTGGILTGQSLIRAAELRSVTTEFQRYQTAVQTFRDKYQALPGDMRDATRFWGRAASTADCVTNSAATVTASGVCDGDGDGTAEEPAAPSQVGEIFQVWRHLAIAGLIEGNYSGIAGSGSVRHGTTTNAPSSRVSSALWGLGGYWGFAIGGSNLFDGFYPSPVTIGAATSFDPTGPVFKPEEAWNIDIKIDDGSPARGRIVVRARVSCTVTASGTAITGSAADAARLDSIYNLTSSSTACSLTFPNFLSL